MYYNHLLRSNIQEWRNQLYKSHVEDFSNNFIFFVDKILGTTCLKSIIMDVVLVYKITDEELVKWLNQLYYDQTQYIDQKHKLSYLIHTILYYYQKKEVEPDFFAIGRPYDEINSIFLDRVISPIVNFLHESLDEVNTVLYIIEKYKLRTEWFTKNTLKEKYAAVVNKQYEQIFEDDLRLYLFDQGIDYPFSTPKSASGRADIISLIDTDDPIVLEIKVYDSEKGYTKNRIISGFTQIVKYTNDYHKNTGYLVVFNLDDIEIEIIYNESDKLWPKRVVFNEKIYYVVIVNLNYDTTASKQNVLNKISLDINELTSQS